MSLDEGNPRPLRQTAGENNQSEAQGTDPRRSRWSVLAALTLVTFLLLLDDTAISVALPSIQRQIGLEFGGLEWVVNAYTLAIAAFTLVGGRLADRNGARHIFLFGLLVFIIGSLIAGLAPNAGLLIGARSVQGLGAALVAPASLALIAGAFPRHLRGTALGVWAGVSATALGIGPLIGALITDSLGWNWIFLLNIPLGALAWLVARFLLAKSRAPETTQRLDLGGAALSAAALLTLLLGLNQTTEFGWASPLVLSLFASSVLFFVFFVVHEGRTQDPLVDLALFRNRSFTGANTVTLLATAVMCSLFFFLALYFQTVRGFSALASGASLLPLTLTIISITPLAGRLSDKFNPRTLIVGGMLLLATGLAGLSGLTADTSVGVLMVWLTVTGVGIALARAPTTTVALGAADGSNYGVAAGVFNTFQATGLALGIALMSAILSTFGPNAAFDREFDESHHLAFVQGFSTALAVNAGIAVFAAILAVVMLRGTRRDSRR
ncbi:MFS transporter [Cryobacterium fucosi]|uniref:MFS transporter n=1 Tax=Cryobacterium fucosi TaxID=1259157 RepID=UPI00141A7986|nr:MFS transporter [Cryobacterium fucosi]